jgi:hypothetical protein
MDIIQILNYGPMRGLLYDYSNILTLPIIIAHMNKSGKQLSKIMINELSIRIRVTPKRFIGLMFAYLYCNYPYFDKVEYECLWRNYEFCKTIISSMLYNKSKHYTIDKFKINRYGPYWLSKTTNKQYTINVLRPYIMRIETVQKVLSKSAHVKTPVQILFPTKKMNK